MLVREDFKYTYYANERPSLFHVKEDPKEDRDLAEDPSYGDVLKDFEALLRSIVDPDETTLRAKRDLGLIGADGTDYTETLRVEDLADDVRH